MYWSITEDPIVGGEVQVSLDLQVQYSHQEPGFSLPFQSVCPVSVLFQACCSSWPQCILFRCLSIINNTFGLHSVWKISRTISKWRLGADGK